MESIDGVKITNEKLMAPPTKTDANIKIKEMEIEFLSKFLSSEKQKTEITPEQRIILSVLNNFADNPYSISKGICEKLNISFDESAFRIGFLKEFIENFTVYGIPLNREGRREEVKVISSYFESLKNEEREEQKLTSKLVK